MSTDSACQRLDGRNTRCCGCTLVDAPGASLRSHSVPLQDVSLAASTYVGPRIGAKPCVISAGSWTTTVSYELKERSTQLFGEGRDDAMLDRLEIEFAKNAVALSGKVSTMSEQQLIATWIAYDPETASASAYKGVVKSLLDERT